jgi:hypothetical protein
MTSEDRKSPEARAPGLFSIVTGFTVRHREVERGMTRLVAGR